MDYLFTKNYSHKSQHTSAVILNSTRCRMAVVFQDLCPKKTLKTSVFLFFRVGAKVLMFSPPVVKPRELTVPSHRPAQEANPTKKKIPITPPTIASQPLPVISKTAPPTKTKLAPSVAHPNARRMGNSFIYKNTLI